MFNRILLAVLGYFCPAILAPFPGGITADPDANFGLFGLWANANLYGETIITQATAGTNINVTTAQLLCGVFRMTAGASGGFTITLPTTKNIIAAMGLCVPVDGSFAMPVSFMNDNIAQTGTITAGDASTTLTGTMTIATNTRRLFLMTVTSPSTITINNIGTVAL